MNSLQQVASHLLANKNLLCKYNLSSNSSDLKKELEKIATTPYVGAGNIIRIMKGKPLK